jgi:transcriptional regulator with XRE-family HTH domain
MSTAILPEWRIAPCPPRNDTDSVELGKRIGANIRRAREERGWSLEKLALKCVPPTGYTTISRLEKGKRGLTLDWVERIANALGIDPAELLVGRRDNAQSLQLSGPVANEVARSLARAALEGAEPEPGTVQVMSLMLQDLTAIFSAHPEAYRDPEVARPVVDLASRRSSSSAK